MPVKKILGSTPTTTAALSNVVGEFVQLLVLMHFIITVLRVFFHLLPFSAFSSYLVELESC